MNKSQTIENGINTSAYNKFDLKQDNTLKIVFVNRAARQGLVLTVTKIILFRTSQNNWRRGT